MDDFSKNIYQMYMENNYQFGFYVRRDSWPKHRYAKVLSIQWVTEGKPIKGKPPYFGGFKNPPGHPREGKIMGPRGVTLEAAWFSGSNQQIITTGGNYCWTRIQV